MKLEFNKEFAKRVDNQNFTNKKIIEILSEEMFPKQFVMLPEDQGSSIISKKIFEELPYNYNIKSYFFDFTDFESNLNEFFINEKYLQPFGINNISFQEFLNVGTALMLELANKVNRQFPEKNFEILGIPDEEFMNFVIKLYSIRDNEPSWLQSFDSDNMLARILI